ERWEANTRRAKKGRVARDSRTTPAGGALDEGSGAGGAGALCERLEIHNTPKQGSGLNMAEIELRVLPGQCLNRRIATREELEREVAAWERQRNRAEAKIDWGFSTDKARIKLKKLYPPIKT